MPDGKKYNSWKDLWNDTRPERKSKYKGDTFKERSEDMVRQAQARAQKHEEARLADSRRRADENEYNTSDISTADRTHPKKQRTLIHSFSVRGIFRSMPNMAKGVAQTSTGLSRGSNSFGDHSGGSYHSGSNSHASHARGLRFGPQGVDKTTGDPIGQSGTGGLYDIKYPEQKVDPGNVDWYTKPSS
ncbi:hypothetical protein MRB53_039984 [Persea americana]|nr:hypothetical protein MRB53_039984 [Persea americana]